MWTFRARRLVTALCVPCFMSATLRAAPDRASETVDTPEVVAVASLQAPDGRRLQAIVWETLPSVPTGTKLRLSLVDGSEIVGQFVSAGPETIVLDRNKVRRGPFTAPTGGSLRDPVTFLRSEVSFVRYERGFPAWGKVLLGIGVGYLLVGVVVGLILANAD